jgi:hypothetical protein
VGGRDDAAWVIGDHGSCLESGATFFSGSTSTTKWSVRRHGVYKDSRNKFFLPWVPIAPLYTVKYKYK